MASLNTSVASVTVVIAAAPCVAWDRTMSSIVDADTVVLSICTRPCVVNKSTTSGSRGGVGSTFGTPVTSQPAQSGIGLDVGETLTAVYDMTSGAPVLRMGSASPEKKLLSSGIRGLTGAWCSSPKTQSMDKQLQLFDDLYDSSICYMFLSCKWL